MEIKPLGNIPDPNWSKSVMSLSFRKQVSSDIHNRLKKPKCKRLSLEKALEEPGLQNTWAYFLQGEEMSNTSSPGRQSGCCLTTWWSVCSDMVPAFLKFPISWALFRPLSCLSFVLQWIEPTCMKYTSCTLHPPPVESILIPIINSSSFGPHSEHYL